MRTYREVRALLGSCSAMLPACSAMSAAVRRRRFNSADHRASAEPDPAHSARAGRRRPGAAGHAADRHRPVRHRDRGATRRTAAQSRHDPWRRAVRQAGHHRFELCTGLRQPPDHSRSRREPRRHHRQRRQRRRRLRPGRRPFRAGQSVGDQSGRGDPRAGHASLRLAGDRRRCRLDQQPHSRGAALRSVQSASPAAGHHQGSAAGAGRSRLRNPRTAGCAGERRQGPRRRRAARCRHRQFRFSRGWVWSQVRKLPRPELSLPHPSRSGGTAVRDPARGLQRAATEFLQQIERGVGRRLLPFSRRLCRHRLHAQQQPLWDSRSRRRGPQHPHRCPAGQGVEQGRVSAVRHRDRRGPLLGRLHRLQTQRAGICRSDRSEHRRHSSDLHQQGLGRPQ